MNARPDSIRIGGASGYWGESAMATPQFLREGGLDYIVYDYLAEITMSVMARAKAKSPDGGYASDFVSAVIKPNLKSIASAGVKIISNAGGINPTACAAAVRALITEAGLDLKVAVITGDDLMAQKEIITTRAPDEMFTKDAFPEPEKIASINAYLGAFPIAAALDAGADIVITGRCVDSAVTLGACIHAFGWTADDYDLLASGSLAGHILECGPQATGGNFTDWDKVPDIANIGYPIANISQDGAFSVTKAKSTGGLVSLGTVSEQLVYEIGDPQAYKLPDVVCDFSGVTVHQESEHCVSVSPAKGYAPPDTYKTSLTWADGFRAGLMMSYYGFDADKKARAMAKAAFARTNAILRKFNLGDFTETSVEVIGAESQFGDYANTDAPREVVLKIAARHPDAMGVGLLLKESVGLGLASPPGLSGFAGGRPKPSPVVRLFSYLTPKADISIQIDVDGQMQAFTSKTDTAFDPASIHRPAPPALPNSTEAMRDVPLITLAYGRSGDKGDKANIGIIARDAAFMPYIWAALDEQAVALRFAHFIDGKNKAASVQRFFMPGLPGINFLIDHVLGGGGMASIRNDPQGKGYAQILLAHPVSIPQTLAKTLT
ncbi:MAG: terpene utilization protein AtuA [Robiginitomaculum sp.]|nr:MAG: terpene utilization protein AtuA [Robiginitomaculum sp.]